MATSPTDSIYYPALEIADAEASSDYGSDLNSEDDDLLNELLSRISPLTRHDCPPSLVEDNDGQKGQTLRTLGRQDRDAAHDELEAAMEVTSTMWEEMAGDLDDAQLGGFTSIPVSFRPRRR